MRRTEGGDLAKTFSEQRLKGKKQASTELGLNGKVRIPLGSFQIESEGSRTFVELVPIHFFQFLLKVANTIWVFFKVPFKTDYSS